MSSEENLRQSKLEEFFPQVKPGKSEADLLPKLETSLGINEISSSTVASLLKGEFSVRKFLIIDSRFDYEYEGGHIQGALHITEQCKLVQHLEGQGWEDCPIIIHCEFSEVRGPTLLKQLRNYDRNENMENYPKLSYPELYLMKGGYADFYSNFPELCSPSGYVTCKTRKVKRALTQIQKIHKLL
jgi:rhodanese-related sulfurtransferase